MMDNIDFLEQDLDWAKQDTDTSRADELRDVIAELETLRAENKQVRQFIQNDYDQYNHYHPYARKLLAMYPWLQPTGSAEQAEKGRE